MHVDIDAVGERRVRRARDQDQGGGELDRRRGEARFTNPASKPPVISGTTMRVNVRSLPAPRFSAGLFQADVQLLQRRGGGAQRIGQAARLGDDQSMNQKAPSGTVKGSCTS